MNHTTLAATHSTIIAVSASELSDAPFVFDPYKLAGQSDFFLFIVFLLWLFKWLDVKNIIDTWRTSIEKNAISAAQQAESLRGLESQITNVAKGFEIYYLVHQNLLEDNNKILTSLALDSREILSRLDKK